MRQPNERDLNRRARRESKQTRQEEQEDLEKKDDSVRVEGLGLTGDEWENGVEDGEKEKRRQKTKATERLDKQSETGSKNLKRIREDCLPAKVQINATRHLALHHPSRFIFSVHRHYEVEAASRRSPSCTLLLLLFLCHMQQLPVERWQPVLTFKPTL